MASAVNSWLQKRSTKMRSLLEEKKQQVGESFKEAKCSMEEPSERLMAPLNTCYSIISEQVRWRKVGGMFEKENAFCHIINSRRNKLNYRSFGENISSLRGALVILLILLLETSSTFTYQLTNNLIANNLPPKFVTSSQGGSNSEIVVRVKEGPASIGKLICTLKGEDPDEDALTFGVLGSTASDLLRIENVPGNQANVYLRKELDRETSESHQVVITLTDGKLGRGNWVEDVNDNYPVFAPHRTAISISEDVKVPFVLETIEASDQDEGRFGQVMYKFDDSQTDNIENQKQSSISSMFAIDTIDGKGVITLISPLDYEQRALYQLRILAIDRAIENERLSASTSILVSVEDCEDQPPMFTFVPSITRIPENLPIGAPIVRLLAVDGDRGINNQIQYKLVSVNGQEGGFERQLFSMEPTTGEISVARKLDREAELSASKREQQPGSYVLQVRATELNSAQKTDNSASTELTILLTDVNDELPTFNQVAYYGEILENSSPESLVTLIGSKGAGFQSNQQQVAKVFDRDQGTNGTFTLHLEGEHSKLFEIWPREATNEANFLIKLSPNAHQNVLDFERSKEFQFVIVAREKYNSDSSLRSNLAQMTVYLKDTNDNYPQFEQEVYRVEIPENAIKGMHVCTVRATDLDSGLFGTEGIKYMELRGEKANKFKLDPQTGAITLRTSEHGFDRETVPQHHLIVEARDNNGSGNRNTSQLLIVLLDVNDQAPKFLLDQYEAFIYENELDFQSPLQVQAIDNDAQNTTNSRVTYSIVGGDPQQNFTIDPQTGRIRVRNHSISFPLPSGERSKPASITLGNGDSDLVIDSSNFAQGASNSASMQQVGGLDFERIAQKRDDTRQFNLTIKATDAGIPEQLSDTTKVVIFVYDKNDHAPVFTRPIYHKSIREDAKEGSAVIQVLAQDGDHSPSNSKITYRISSGAGDKFVIDSETGLVSVANGANLDIDRVVGGQKRQNYLLSVIAFDGFFGPNQKSASALVNITIIDVNNKAPEFSTLGSSGSFRASSASSQLATTVAPNAQQQFMVVHVNEDAPYGLIVTRVVATDLDSSADLRYSIRWAQSEARNEDMLLVDPALIKDLFSIEPTDGTIKVAKPLDRETFDQVKLRLQVEDIAAQTADQVAHAYLLVKISDVNDNRPTFKRSLYKAVVNENSISGTSVITLTADDRDLNKTLRYSLDGTSEMLRLVRINPRSGEVTVNDKIDRELYSMINVTVKAEDYGQPQPLTGTAQLIITVRDENDNNPSFLNSSQLSSRAFHSNPLDASPRNHNMNESSLSTYRLRSLGSHRATYVDSTPPMDVERLESMIEETPSLPLLSPGSTARIREDAPIGYQIAYVRAEDVDVANNGRVTYLLDAASSGGKFRIDRDSGVISVAGTLDRETSKQYSLIIEACDNYDLGYATGESRRAFAQVSILISDVNDNAPLVTTNLQTNLHGSEPNGNHIQASYDDIMNSPGPYELALTNCLFISEFQPVNEPILTITATDADDPSTPNGQIELEIVNNLPQNELFGLIAIQQQQKNPPRATTNALERTAPDYLGFGELNLGESGSKASVIAIDGPEQDQNSPVSDEDEEQQRAKNARPKRWARMNLDEPTYSSQARQLRAPKKPATGEPRASTIRLASTSAPTVSATMSSRTINYPQSAPWNPSNQATLVEAGEQQVHVVVKQSLKERVGNYSILVRATDRGEPSLSSVKVINICVQDVNNHAPVFVRPPLNHTIRVHENATIGTIVTQVEATDLDHGLNGELQYFLKPTNIQNSNNDWQSFKIDRLSGVVSTTKLFNRQLKKYYTLRVQASDFGKPTNLSSDIDINIMIVNSGQYQPEFDVQTQSLQFTENVAPGVEWFALLPTTNLDDDPALINAPETGSSVATANWLATPCYFIVDSDDLDQVFHLDRYTHRLTNQKVIDREKKSNFTLLVQASNNCNKQPVAPSYATIRVPSSIESGRESSTLSTPVAIDYRSSNVDSVGETTSLQAQHEGSLRLARSIDANGSFNETSAKLISGEQQQDRLNAIDALLVADKTLLKVFIRVKDVNDNAPKFTQRVYTGGITTEANFGTIFMIVQALDADADANSQIVYSIVKPIKGSLANSSLSSNKTNPSAKIRQKRALSGSDLSPAMQKYPDENSGNDISLNESDELFVINPQTGEISLNFDPQKHMKGYFEFEVLANDTDGFFDSAKVFIYLLRQDQRVKFVLRLTPQELRQRLNKFRSVFGNITGAIVNIDSYKYYENHDGTVDKKKTSLYLHFVNPEHNTIIDVDKVLTLIDNNIEYLDELYKEFHVLSSEAAHLPLSSSALIDPIDQVRTGLLGISSFLALILVLVIGLCLNQRTKYERQLKAATVSAFGSSPLHLNPDYQSQTNLPNTNLHSQDPNPIWVNGFSEQDWLNHNVVSSEEAKLGLNSSSHKMRSVAIEDGDYLSSENSDLNSLNGTHGVHYNATTTATPRDSLNSSHGRVSGSNGSGSTSTTNDRQALCRTGRQTPTYQQQQARVKEHEVVGVLKNGKPIDQSNLKRRPQTYADNATGHSTFGAFKEVTIYTEHQDKHQLSAPAPTSNNNLVRTIHNQKQQTSQVNKIASQFNQSVISKPSQVYIGQHQQQRIVVHANGADVNEGIIKTESHQQQPARVSTVSVHTDNKHQQFLSNNNPQNIIDSNLNKLSILNLETTEL